MDYNIAAECVLELYPMRTKLKILSLQEASVLCAISTTTMRGAMKSCREEELLAAGAIICNNRDEVKALVVKFKGCFTFDMFEANDNCIGIDNSTNNIRFLNAKALAMCINKLNPNQRAYKDLQNAYINKLKKPVEKPGPKNVNKETDIEDVVSKLWEDTDARTTKLRKQEIDENLFFSIYDKLDTFGITSYDEKIKLSYEMIKSGLSIPEFMYKKIKEQEFIDLATNQSYKRHEFVNIMKAVIEHTLDKTTSKEAQVHYRTNSWREFMRSMGRVIKDKEYFIREHERRKKENKPRYTFPDLLEEKGMLDLALMYAREILEEQDDLTI